jgi:nitronate monooxygenase
VSDHEILQMLPLAAAREADLVGDSQTKQDYQNDVARGAKPPLPVWAGEATDLI